MRVGIAIEETWDFFHEIYADLKEHYNTQLFKRRTFRTPFFTERINRAVFSRDIQVLLRSNDVVFFEWASHLLAAASTKPKVCGIVTRLHRYEMYKWIDHVNWDTVDKIILVSQAKRQEFTQYFPEHRSKTIVIPVAISLQKFSPKQKLFNGDIGILCHLTPRKRVYEIILAFYELRKQTALGHLHIGGGSHPLYKDYFEALLHLVTALDLQDKVTFYGNVTDTPNWYHKIDIFISNSYSEGLQVALMEAMASGCYCLSHRWSGADELLPEECLFYTSNELIEKILSYYEMPAKQKKNYQEIMRTIVSEKFNIDKTKVSIRSVIEEVGSKYVSGI